MKRDLADLAQAEINFEEAWRDDSDARDACADKAYAVCKELLLERDLSYVLRAGCHLMLSYADEGHL